MPFWEDPCSDPGFGVACSDPSMRRLREPPDIPSCSSGFCRVGPCPPSGGWISAPSSASGSTSTRRSCSGAGFRPRTRIAVGRCFGRTGESLWAQNLGRCIDQPRVLIPPADRVIRDFMKTSSIACKRGQNRRFPKYLYTVGGKKKAPAVDQTARGRALVERAPANPLCLSQGPRRSCAEWRGRDVGQIGPRCPMRRTPPAHNGGKLLLPVRFRKIAPNSVAYKRSEKRRERLEDPNPHRKRRRLGGACRASWRRLRGRLSRGWCVCRAGLNRDCVEKPPRKPNGKRNDQNVTRPDKVLRRSVLIPRP